MEYALPTTQSNQSEDLLAKDGPWPTGRVATLTSRMLSKEFAVVRRVSVVLAALIVLEHLVPWLRAYVGGHALVVEIVSGGVLVGMLFLELERAYQRSHDDREKERARREVEPWKLPAVDAVQAYVDHADHFTAELTSMLTDEDPSFKSAKTKDEYTHAYNELAKPEAGPDYFFSRLNRLASNGARRLSPVADRATSTLALYPPLSANADRICRAQHATDELARRCHDIHYRRRFHCSRQLTSEESKELREAVQRLAELTVRRRELIQAIQTDLTTAEDGSGSGDPVRLSPGNPPARSGRRWGDRGVPRVRG